MWKALLKSPVLSISPLCYTRFFWLIFEYLKSIDQPKTPSSMIFPCERMDSAAEYWEKVLLGYQAPRPISPSPRQRDLRIIDWSLQTVGLQAWSENRKVHGERSFFGGFGPEKCRKAGKGLITFIFRYKIYPDAPRARVAELADALDLGSSGATRRGSTPLSRTTSLFLLFQYPFPYRQEFNGLMRMFLWFIIPSQNRQALTARLFSGFDETPLL